MSAELDAVCCLIGWNLGNLMYKDINYKEEYNYKEYQKDQERQFKENEIIYNNFMNQKENREEPPNNIRMN